MSRVISAGFVIFLLISSFAVMMVEPLTGSGAEDECSTSSAAPMGSRGSSRGVHPIIRINSNIEFNNQASLEVWDGLGLEGNPYIIENYVIDAQGAGNCIYIGNITLGPYFIIRNCTVTNASLSSSGYDSAGITLFNCQYGVVEDCIATDNMIGIYLNLRFN